jgi:hypothetical protein
MMKPDEDVILDLLPLYFGGDASAASRAMIEAYFEEHPRFAQEVRAAQANVPGVPGTAAPNGGHAAITRIKAQLKWRSAQIALAIFCSIAPFTFVFDNGRVVYFMWRDAPLTASVYAGVALIAWIAVWLSARRTETP